MKYSGKAHHHVAVPIPHPKKPLAHNPGKALLSFRNLHQEFNTVSPQMVLALKKFSPLNSYPVNLHPVK